MLSIQQAAAAAKVITQPQQLSQAAAKYTRADLLVVMPTSHDRLALVEASRRWRRGIRTFVLADKPLSPTLMDKARLHRETWSTYRDIETPGLTIGPRSGDLRAAMVPFVANFTFGANSYKWMLYGDDDTVFFIDNILAVLNTMDHTVPYLISDALWFPEGGNGTKLHPNREAPRCLPCKYKDELLDEGSCPGHSGFIAPKGCPCSPPLIFNGNWAGGEPKMKDGRGVFDRKVGDFVSRPGDWHSPYPGWWYMVHGGAGAIISSAAMLQGSYAQLENYITTHPPQSGDAMFTKAMWYQLAVAPTDPGYGFCRAHIQMFDPGYKGPRAPGPEDAGSADKGADPTGTIGRLETALAGTGCDDICHDQLKHTLTVHVRSRYAATELFGGAAADAAQDGPPKFRAAVHLIEQLSILGEQYVNKQRSTSHYIPLWHD
ncbi:hypothetical protein WJX72_001161 [[Myrmecia] bisecta]|uniref:Hexosyltransferase n=1 Tax=[Myrmecia] bisecta TaxID=41462 RepID=A0AAW1Q3S9_9CHLO